MVRSRHGRREHAGAIRNSNFRTRDAFHDKVGMVARIALVGAFRRHQLDRLQPMRDADRVYRRQKASVGSP